MESKHRRPPQAWPFQAPQHSALSAGVPQVTMATRARASLAGVSRVVGSGYPFSWVEPGQILCSPVTWVRWLYHSDLRDELGAWCGCMLSSGAGGAGWAWGLQLWLSSILGDGQPPEGIGCGCDPQGSISSQCDAAGQCQCKVSAGPAPHSGRDSTAPGGGDWGGAAAGNEETPEFPHTCATHPPRQRWRASPAATAGPTTST